MLTNANVEVEKILTWLRREAKQGAGLVALTHQSVGDTASAIGRWPVADADSDEVLVVLGRDLYKAACDDADGQNAPGEQQYVAFFFLASDLRNPTSRFSLRVVSARQAALGPPGEGLSTEPPTEKGLVAQLMRQNEVTHRQAWTVLGHALGMMERHSAQVSQENLQLRQGNFELTRGYEGLLSERHIRELAAQTAQFEREQKAQFYNRLWLFAPAIMSTLGGKAQSGPRALPAGASGPAEPTSATQASEASAPAAPPPASELAVQLRSILDSMTPEQVATLQQTLSPEQFLALAALWSSLSSLDTTPPSSAPSSSASEGTPEASP